MITSLETDFIPCLCVDRVPGYRLIQLAKGFQGSQLLQHEEDDERPLTRSNLPQPNPKSAARSSKADGEPVVGSTAPIGEVPRELFLYWSLHLHSFICLTKGKVPWLLGGVS